MTISTLLMMIGAIALVLTAAVGMLFKAHKSWLMTYLQNFSGAFFIFSGMVKAVDPLGTAYKMEQYFAEFESVFSETWLSFMAPIFPWLAGFAIAFSVFMIVYEIVLGIMLIIGAKPKLAAWGFLALVAFFTVLTGFTYLTGYVPNGVNFFEFGKWGAYLDSNMKVTDCGCFGDFIKLKPKVTFIKDVCLMFPALYFVFKHKDMHQLFTINIRNIITVASTVLLFVYCLSNYVWDIPAVDFRAFAEGTNVRLKKKAVELAGSNVQVTAYNLTNKETGKVINLEYTEFLKKFSEYPKEQWSYEQIKSEGALLPQDVEELKTLGDVSWIEEYKVADSRSGAYKYAIPESKLSDFDISDTDGQNVTEQIIDEAGYSFMIVAYKLPHGEEKNGNFTFPNDYKKRYTEIVNPVLNAAEKDGHKTFGIAGGAGKDLIDDLRQRTQSAYPFYEADDILLKTIVRSNPGIVLWKDGNIVAKWHYKKLPSYAEIKAKYMR